MRLLGRFIAAALVIIACFVAGAKHATTEVAEMCEEGQNLSASASSKVTWFHLAS